MWGTVVNVIADLIQHFPPKAKTVTTVLVSLRPYALTFAFSSFDSLIFDSTFHLFKGRH